MHVDTSPAAGDRAAAYLLADDASDAEWPGGVDMVAIDEDGAWGLTAHGEAAMTLVYGRTPCNRASP